MPTKKESIDAGKCPKCGQQVIGVEYSLLDDQHYDGISEWACIGSLDKNAKPCDWRSGRWCGQLLKDKEIERRYCDGKHAHPTHA